MSEKLSFGEVVLAGYMEDIIFPECMEDVIFLEDVVFLECVEDVVFLGYM